MEDSHAFSTDDGSIYWSRGYAPVHGDGNSGYYFARLGEPLDQPGVLYCRVAGAKYRLDAIQDRRFDPGSTLLLQAEPENPHDENAVGVWDLSGSLQAGYIPADCSGEIAARMRAGEHVGAFVVREIRRDSKRGPRTTLHILVLPAGELKLSIIDDE